MRLATVLHNLCYLHADLSISEYQAELCLPRLKRWPWLGRFGVIHRDPRVLSVSIFGTRQELLDLIDMLGRKPSYSQIMAALQEHGQQIHR